MYKKRFYSSVTCLAVETSERGIFLEMAEVNNEAEKINGMSPFKWDEKLTCKMSPEEIQEINYVIKIFFGFEVYRATIEDSSDFISLIGEAGYKAILKDRFPKQSFNNYLLFHQDKRKETVAKSQVGVLFYKGRIAFNITKGDKKISLALNKFSALSITKYFDWVSSTSYSFDFYKKNDEDSYVSFEELSA